MTESFNLIVLRENVNVSRLEWRVSYFSKDTDDLGRADESSKWYGHRINMGSVRLTEYKIQVEPPIR